MVTSEPMAGGVGDLWLRCSCFDSECLGYLADADVVVPVPPLLDGPDLENRGRVKSAGVPKRLNHVVTMAAVGLEDAMTEVRSASAPRRECAVQAAQSLGPSHGSRCLTVTS
jgi:hypothetical protein